MIYGLWIHVVSYYKPNKSSTLNGIILQSKQYLNKNKLQMRENNAAKSEKYSKVLFKIIKKKVCKNISLWK